jgi:iron complex outermembrane receptor protein
VYGSDALGGVINVITRQDFQGAELMYGQATVDPEGGDREEGSVLFGASSATTSIIAGASWNDRDIIFARDLPWYTPGGSVFSNSFAEPGNIGTWAAVPGGCNDSTGNSPGSFYLINNANALDGSGRRCAYNFALVSADEASVSNASAFAYMQHEFTDNWSVYSDITATRTESFGRYAPVPDTSNVGNGGLGALSANSPNNPTNPDSPLYDPSFGPQRELDWWHRFDALGNRDNFVDTRLDDILVGFEGFVFDEVELDFGIRNTSNKVYDVGYNYLLRSAARDFIESGEYDLANPTLADPAVLNAMKVTISRISRFDQDELFGSAAFDLFATPWGDVQWVVGGEYIEQDYDDQYDSLSEAGVVGGSAGNSAGGQRDVTSFYFETLIPLGDFEISVAGRNDDYSDFGSEFSPKVSFRWQALDTLTVRGSWGEGFRAPTLDIITQLDSFSADPVSDAPNCLALGLPPTCTEQINGLRTANPDLSAEESDQYSFGVAWEPTDWLFGKIDYYNIDITNRINFFSAQELIDRENAGDPIPPGLGVDRLPSGAITLITQGFGNEGSIKQDGFDANVQTNFELFGGLLTNNFQVSYINSFEIDGGRDTAGDPGVPEYRAALWNQYAIGSFSFAYNINVIGDQADEVVDGVQIGHVPTWVTHDLQANWFTPWNGQVVAGCQNCGNKQPPIDVGNVGSRDYDFNLYNGFGRIWYARYRQSF